MKAISEDSLQHFGVIGMKWGIRRQQSAIDANKKDVASLRKHGMHKEAEAVAKVGQKLQAKNDKVQDKIDAKPKKKGGLLKELDKALDEHNKKDESRSLGDKIAVQRLAKTDPSAARRLKAIQMSDGNSFVKKYHEKKLADINPSAARDQKTRDGISSIFDAFMEED